MTCNRCVMLLVVADCIGACKTPLPVLTSSVHRASQAPIRAVARRIDCDVSGNYRLRFPSNGVDGWWLRLSISGGKAQVVADQAMLGLKRGPIDLSVGKACELLLTTTTTEAGDLRIKLVVDARGAVNGELARTDEDCVSRNKTTFPIRGLRETRPAGPPSCIRPGVYRIKPEYSPRQKWIIEGTPWQGRFPVNVAKECEILANHEALVRIESLAERVFFDEVDEHKPPYHQSFGRGEVVRTGACAITVSYDVTDFTMTDAKLVFKGDQLRGVAGSLKLDMFEDGTNGENLWSCIGRGIPILGRRIDESKPIED